MRARRSRLALELIAGFLVVAAPWVAFSLSRGVVPGAALVTGLTTFYTVEDRTRTLQDQLPAVVDSLARQYALLGAQAVTRQ